MTQQFGARTAVALLVIVGAAGPAKAQLAMPADTSRTVVVETQREDVPPANPDSENILRYFVDTIVGEVAVDEMMTVAQMAPLPESPCRSQAYVYGRERPKWLYQTGRLLQAMREGAPIRVSFSCVEGFQSINAVQFLAPPTGEAVADIPRRNNTFVLTDTTPSLRAAVVGDRAPLPANAIVTTPPSREERVRQIPLP